MKEIVASVSGRGRVTIPADVRRHLGVGAPDKVAFVIGDDGTVQVRPVPFTLESVLGALPALPNESLDLGREIEEATDEAIDRRMRRWRTR